MLQSENMTGEQEMYNPNVLDCSQRNLYLKISGLRKDLLTLDWSDDKIMKGGSLSYPYLSTDKVKRNVAPLFAKHGLELKVCFNELESREPVGEFTSHWTVKMTAYLIDIDTGEFEQYSAYGEATDKNDKAINKAQTSAFKQWITSTFSIADGIDPEVSYNSPSGSFHKRTEAEEEEVKSKILANAEKPPMPKPPADKPKREPKPAEERKAPKEVRTMDESALDSDPAPAPEVVEPVPEIEPMPEIKEIKMPEAPKAEEPAPVAGFKPSGVQAKAIERITTTYEARAKAGEISAEDYNQMSMDCASIASVKDATAFIKKYRVG